jgi:hypothetical protein
MMSPFSPAVCELIIIETTPPEHPRGLLHAPSAADTGGRDSPDHPRGDCWRHRGEQGLIERSSRQAHHRGTANVDHTPGLTLNLRAVDLSAAPERIRLDLSTDTRLMAGLPMTLPAATHRACPLRMARDSLARRCASTMSSRVKAGEQLVSMPSRVGEATP